MVTVLFADGSDVRLGWNHVAIIAGGVFVQKVFYPMHRIVEIRLDDDVHPRNIAARL